MGKSEFNKDGNLIYTISTFPLQIAVLIFPCSSRKIPLFRFFVSHYSSLLLFFFFKSYSIHFFINKSLLSVYQVLGTVLATRDILMNKKDKVFALA